MYRVLFIHSSKDGHLGCFYVLTIKNSIAMNIYVQVFIWTYVLISFECIRRSGPAGSYNNSLLVF